MKGYFFKDNVILDEDGFIHNEIDLEKSKFYTAKDMSMLMNKIIESTFHREDLIDFIIDSFPSDNIIAYLKIKVGSELYGTSIVGVSDIDYKKGFYII